MLRMKAFPVYLIMAGADSISRNTMYVLLSVYYVLVVHMSPLQLVLVGTALEASYFLFQVPTGLFADTRSRKLAIAFGLFVVGACFVVEGLIPVFAAIIAAEILRGAGEAFFDGADAAWLADELGEERFGRALVRGAQVGQAGAIAGTLAGVALGSLRLNLPVVIGGGVLMGLSVFLLLAMPEEGFSPAPRPAVNRRAALGATLCNATGSVRDHPVLLGLLIAELFLGAASEGYDRLWEAHLLRDLHLPAIGALHPVVWFGVISVGSGVIGIATGQIFRRHLDRVTRSPIVTARTLLALQVLAIANILLFALAGSLGLALAALAVSAMLGTMNRPIKTVWLNQSIPSPGVRATIFSFMGSANAIGQTAGGPPIGVVGNIISLRAAIAATGLILWPVLVIYGWIMGRPGASAEDQDRIADVQPV